MKKLLAIAATTALLIACRDQTTKGNAAANVSAANSEAPANAVASANPLGAPVDAATAKKLMHERHEAMEKIGKATKSASRELKSDAPNMDAVKAAAATIAQASQNVGTLFPPGSGPEAGKTHALPAVWEKPEDFAAKAHDFQQAATAFDAAAKSGDVAATKARFEALGKTCKACHDGYRAKDKD